MGWENEICTTGPDHMTKMAVMSIYDKNLKKSSSLEPKGSIRYSSTTKFV